MGFVDVTEARMDAYTDAMAKGLEEKLFFLDSLPEGGALLDFGCADGRLLGEVAKRRPDLLLAGLDISPPALARAAASGVPATWFLDTDTARQWAKASQRPTTLLASSVLHEVAHYGGRSAWDLFWRFAGSGVFSNLAVRDFSLSGADAAAANPAFCTAVHQGLPLWQRASFEAIWGPIVTQGLAVHAALKAPWVLSWDREGPENYFPIWREELAEQVTHAFGTPTLWSPHAHAYSDAQSLQRFGMGLPCPTHITVLA